MIREVVLWLMLSATAYRLTRLVIKDTFPPVLYIRDRLAGGWRKLTGAEQEEYYASPDKGRLIREWELDATDLNRRYVRRAKWSPSWLAELITCPWCASAYVSGAVTAVADLTIGVQWPWLMGFAVWALAAPVAARDWP